MKKFTITTEDLALCFTEGAKTKFAVVTGFIDGNTIFTGNGGKFTIKLETTLPVGTVVYFNNSGETIAIGEKKPSAFATGRSGCMLDKSHTEYSL